MEVQFWIRLISKVILYCLWIYFIYKVISKKEPNKNIYLIAGIVFSLFSLFFVEVLIWGLFLGTEFIKFGVIILLACVLFSVFFTILFFWIYFKKFKRK